MTILSKYPVIKPTLMLDFANAQMLDPRITFTRATTATYYDGKTYAKAEENLQIRSQEFDNTTAWLVSDTTVSANSTAAPDGTTTADTLAENTVNASHGLIDQTTVATSGLVYTFSVFAKQDTATVIQLIGRSGAFGTNVWATFNLSTGAVGSVGSSTTASIVSAGNGWYRCIITGTSTATATGAMAIGFTDNSASATRFPTYTGTGKQAFIWGAQIEQRSSVTAYTPTTTQPITNYIPQLMTAAANVPRFDFNPTTRSALGLLIEESRTNLFTYSAQFDNAAWTKSQTTVSSNTNIAPDGTQSADSLIENTATSAHSTVQSSSYISGTYYTLSVFAKNIPGSATRYLSLVLSSAFFGSNYAAVFDLTTGTRTATNAFASTITPVGNGWYRCSITQTATVTGTGNSAIYRLTNSSTSGLTSYTGDGYSGVFLWGAQLETGEFPTSYIPTTTASAQRNADTAVMTGTNFSSWYNTTQGTFFAEWVLGYDVTSTAVYEADDNTVNNVIRLRYANAGTTNDSAVISSGVTQTSLSVTTQQTFNTRYKNAMAYKQDDFARSASGAVVVTSTSGTIPTVDRLRIGYTAAGTEQLNGWICRIFYFPFRVSNENLQSLSV